MTTRGQTVAQWNNAISTLQGQISDLESQDRSIQEAIVQNQRELEANTRLDFPRLAAENQTRITALEAERARVNTEITNLDGDLRAAEVGRDNASSTLPNVQGNAPPPIATPLPDNRPPNASPADVQVADPIGPPTGTVRSISPEGVFGPEIPLAAPSVRPTASNPTDVDLPPALAAIQVPPTTGAVPVDVQPVPASSVRPITDPDIRTPPDLAIERAAEIAAAEQADSVGQGADTTLVIDRRIDPALGEGPATLVVGPTTVPAPVNIDNLPGGQEALFAAATEPGAVDPEFAAELASLQQAQENERPLFAPGLVAPIDGVDDGFDDNPPVFEPGEIGDEDPEVAALLEQQEAIARADVAQAFNVAEPGLVNPETDPAIAASFEAAEAGPSVSAVSPNTIAPKIKDAQQQSTDSARVNTPASADWRVRLSLAPGSTYLYNAQGAEQSILAPLRRTGGVVFPYTPQIDMNYQARYDSVDLMHSNYRGQFYRNSSVDQVNIRGIFTAQDTREAAYLLAVITFFKSVTKMFYGSQDPNRGMPPPLVFLTGLGQYQFNSNPCVVSSFQYNLPSDVDYIRANGFNNYGINMDNRRQQSSGPPGTGILGAIAQVNRLLNSNLVQGVLGNRGGNQATNPVSSNNSKTNYTNSTYVPTKMEINLTLLPIQTRKQMSTQFDLNKFAQGKLLQTPGGFW